MNDPFQRPVLASVGMPAEPRLLVVDDDAMDRRRAVRHLEDILTKVQRVDIASDLEEAKTKLLSTHYHFVLVDEGLGFESGLELIRWLRERKMDVVSILMTGNDTPEMENAALEAGAWYFIPKAELTPPVLRRSLRFAWVHACQERELEKSRLEVAQKEAFVSLTLDASKAAIMAIGMDGHIVLANSSARLLLGIGDAVMPMRWPSTCELLRSDDYQPLNADDYPIDRIMAGDPPQSEVVLLKIRPYTATLYIRIDGQLIPGDDGHIRGVLLMQDVTQEEQNRERAERAGRLEALGQMTGGIAHDFNNLLATILASAEVAQLMPKQTTASLETIIRVSTRGAGLTKRLLNFAGPTIQHWEIVRIDQFLTQIEELANRTLGGDPETNIEIVLDEIDPALVVKCDIAELEHALINLIFNARDAIKNTGKKGQIRLFARPLTGHQIDERGRREGVSGRYDSAFVEVTVSDNGPGMPEHIRRRSTDPFFTTKPLQAGSGLGLTMVAAFVDKQQGTLRIYSDEGMGTTIRMMLPAADKELAKAAARQIEFDAIRGKGQRILLVEDEDDLRTMTCVLLASLGYEPVPSVNAVEALERLKSGLQIDAILTDIIMPGGLNGRDMARQLHEEGSSIPLAFMSGYAGAEDDTMDHMFIQKPCAMEELARLMAQLVSQMKERP